MAMNGKTVGEKCPICLGLGVRVVVWTNVLAIFETMVEKDGKVKPTLVTVILCKNNLEIFKRT